MELKTPMLKFVMDNCSLFRTLRDVYNDVLYYPGFTIGSETALRITNSGQYSKSTLFAQRLQATNDQNRNAAPLRGSTSGRRQSPFRPSSPFFQTLGVAEARCISPRDVFLTHSVSNQRRHV